MKRFSNGGSEAARRQQEEDATEQCVPLQTEQIAGEKTENSEDCSQYGETETTEEKKNPLVRIS